MRPGFAAATTRAESMPEIGLIIAFAAALVALGVVLIIAVRLTRRRTEVRVDAAAVLASRPEPEDDRADGPAVVAQAAPPGAQAAPGAGATDAAPRSAEEPAEDEPADAEPAEGEGVDADPADDDLPVDAELSPDDDPAPEPLALDEEPDPEDLPADLDDLPPDLDDPAPPDDGGRPAPEPTLAGHLLAVAQPSGADGSKLGMLHPRTERPEPVDEPRNQLLATAARLAGEGSWTAAAACYREAGDMANAALCYRRAGDLRKVVECLEEIGDHYRVGRILARRGDRQRAAVAFAKVDPGHPKYAKSLLLRAKLAWDARAHDRSTELIRMFLDVATDPHQIVDARKLLAKLLEVGHAYGEAMDVLLLLQAELPDDPTVARRLARVRSRVEEQVRRVDVRLLVPEPDVTSSGVTIAPTEHDVTTAHDHPTDRYELFERVGEGAIGKVYKGYDHDRGQLVAVKFMQSWGQSPAIAREALQELAREMAPVQHRGIARLIDIGELEGHPFIAAEYVIGRSLDRRLVQGVPANPKLLLAVAMQLGGALDALHDLGLVHGDLKPTNVLLRDEPENALVLTDAGLAQALRMVDPSLVAPDDAAAYRAPEVGGPVGPAADVFSMGVLLYRMLTGALPFAGRSGPISAPPPPPWVVERSVDRELGHLVLRCLDPDPEQRPARAGQVAAIVRAALIHAV